MKCRVFQAILALAIPFHRFQIIYAVFVTQLITLKQVTIH